MKTKMSSLHSKFAAALAVASIMSSCSQPDDMIVNVSNPSGSSRCEIVEIPLKDVAERLGDGFYAVYCNDSLVPSQITSDSLLIFQVNIEPNARITARIALSDTAVSFSNVAVGRVYPERPDDLAWENDLVGFRAYGPATQAKGERAYGYDIFFKHPTPRPILEDLYAPETSPRTWQIVDSLKAISKEAAQEYINTISYHIDHGLGMDCYAVGPTLGDGVAARVVNDTIVFPWCYETAEVLDNGPLRFTARLTFAPVDSIVETRLITLDAGKHLNACTVSYAGLRDSADIVAGVPLRDESPVVNSSNFIAYADPTQGPDNGKAMLGVIIPDRNVTFAERDGHAVLATRIAPRENFRYYFGFAWDRADITDMEAWTEYLENYKKTPLIISY